MRTIDEVRAIVKFDEKAQTEGVVAFLSSHGWLPLISADADRWADIERVAKDIATQNGETFKIIALTVRTEIGEITP